MERISIKYLNVNYMSKMISSPINIGLISILFEVILLDFELDIILPFSSISFDDYSKSKRIRSNILYQFVGWLDFTRKMESSTGTVAIIFLLFSSTLLILCTLVLSAKDEDRYRKVGESDMRKKHSVEGFRLFVSYVIHCYGYLNYFFVYFFINLFKCSSFTQVNTVNIQDVGVNNTDLLNYQPIKSTETVTELRWRLAEGSQCFGITYILTLVFVLIMFLLNFHLQNTSEIIRNFYPSKEIIDGTNSRAHYVHSIIIYFLFFLKFMINFLESKFLIGPHQITALIMYFFGFIVLLITRPYLNPLTMQIKVIKYLVVLSTGLWIIIVRNNTRTEDSTSGESGGILSPHTSSFIIYTLTIGASIRLFLPLLRRNFALQIDDLLVTDKKPPLSKNRILDLIFEFENLRANRSSLLEQNKKNMNAEIVFKYACVYKSHKKICRDQLCLCKVKDLSLRSKQIHGIVNSKESEELFVILFLIDSFIEEHLKLFKTGLWASKENEYLSFLKIWSIWNLQNYGSTKQIISVIYSLENNFILDASSKYKKNPYKDFTLQLIKLVSRCYIEEFEKSNEYTGSVIIKSKKKRIISHKTSNESILDFRPMSDFLENLSKSKVLVGISLDNKKEFLESILTSNPNVAEISQKYLKSRLKTEQVLSRICTDSTDFILFKSKVVELFYYYFIKEDFYTTNNKIRQLSSKIIEDSLLIVFQIDEVKNRGKDPGVVIGVCGESIHFNKIRYLYGKPESLGYTDKELIGQELDILLPNAVSDFHRFIIGPQFELNHQAQRKNWLKLYSKSKDDYLKPSKVVYRMFPFISQGLEYIGSIRVQIQSNEKILTILVDQDGIVRDSCINGAKIFSLGDHISNYNDSITSYVIWNTKKVQLEKLGYQEVKSDTITEEESAYKQQVFEMLQASSGLMEEWYPVTITNKDTDEKFDFNSHIDTFINYSSKRLFYIIKFDQMQYVNRMHSNPQTYLSKYLTISKPLQKRGSQFLDNQNEMSQFIGTGGLHDFTARLQTIKSSDNQPQEEDQRESKVDFSSKYAHQTFDLHLPSSASINESIEKMKKIMVKPRITTSKDQFKRRVGHIGNLLRMNILSPSKEESQYEVEFSEQSKKQHKPLDMIKSMFYTIDNKSSKMKHSRFIHHNINFKGIKKNLMIFITPILLFIIASVVLYSKETKNIDSLRYLIDEVAVWDSIAGFMRGVHQHMTYIETRRYITDGILADDNFQKFGIDNLTSHIDTLMKLPENQGLIYRSFLKIENDQSDSNFTKNVDKGILNDVKMLEVRVLNANSLSIETKMVRSVDAVKISQVQMDKILKNPSLHLSYIIGDTGERTDSPNEEAASFNLYNPLLKYIENGIMI